MLGGGVPYCPWFGGPWGEHGVCHFDEPLRAGGRSRSGYHVVVQALEDCNPDLRRGVVTVCRWGGEVVVWGAEAYPLMRHVNAGVCRKVPIAYFCCLFPRFHTQITNSTRGWPLLGCLSLLTAGEQSKGKEKARHKRGKRLCTRVYVLITQCHL